MRADDIAPAAAPGLTRPLSGEVALLGGVYFVLAFLAIHMGGQPGAITNVWFANAAAIAILATAPVSRWPLLLAVMAAANLAANVALRGNLALSASFVPGNLVEVLIGSWLLRRFDLARDFDTDIAAFGRAIVAGALLPQLAGATIGAATLQWHGFATFQGSWFGWYGDSTLGALTLLPLSLALRQMPRGAWRTQLFSPAALMFAAGTVGAVFVAFWTVPYPFVYLTLPLVASVFFVAPVATFGLCFVLVLSICAGLDYRWFQPKRYAAPWSQLFLYLPAAATVLPAQLLALVVSRMRRLLASTVASERSLRDNEARLKLAMLTGRIGLQVWDHATKELYISPEWKQLLGYEDHEIANRPEAWLALVHPEDRSRVDAEMKAYFADLKPGHELEFRLHHRNGDYRRVLARADPVHDTDGRAQRSIACYVDITERKQAEERLRELSRRLLEVEEIERRNINRELHDRIGQNLSALNLSLEIIRGQLLGNSLPAVRTRLDDAQVLLEATMKQVRNVMADLRPIALDDYGLIAALRTYAEPFSTRHGVPVTVSGKEPAPRLPSAAETALFRIAQEALTNVAKHARARSIEVRLVTDNGRVELTISDDGIGFDPGPAGPECASWGLRTMRERAAAVGARLRVESAPQCGTHVVVEVERETA